MKKRTFNMATLLAAFIFAIILVTISLYMIVYQSRLRGQYIDILEENQVATSEHLSSEIDEKFVIVNIQVNSIVGALNNFDYQNLELLDKYFSSQTNDLLISSEYILTNSEGIIYYTYPYNELLIGNDESSKEYFEKATLLKDIYWSKPYKFSTTGEDSITVSFQSEDFYIIMNINLSYLDDVYNNIVTQESNRELMVVDKFGIIIYDSSTTNDDIQLPLSGFGVIRLSDNNTIFNFTYNDHNYIAVKNTIQHTEWTLILYQSAEVIESFTDYFEVQLIELNAFVLIVFIISLSLATYGFSKKVSSYDNLLSELTRGNHHVVFQPSRVRVLNTLSQKLNTTNLSLQETTKKLSTIAYEDSLTGILNRESLKKVFKEKVLLSDISVILVNIKRFSLYNESYGYDYGNEILKKFSEKISSILRDDDVWGRLENDSFIIFTTTDSDQIVEDIEGLFLTPLEVDQIKTNISLKYYIIDKSLVNNNFEVMITDLQQMMHKDGSKYQNIHHFKAEQSSYYERQIEIELSLEESLVNRSFDVVFQPIVFKDQPDKIRGVEALARWNHPRLNNISPNEFIPILEKTHKIHRLDQLVMFESIKHIQSLSKSIKYDLVLSCNVSVETILRDGFVEFVMSTVERFKYNPNYLEIEITESTIIESPDKVKSIINELTSHGIRFSQDDFGDGYSSLNYLTQLNISTLKLSKNLIDQLPKGFNNRLLVHSVIELAHELGYEVIVEGVEDEEVFQILAEFNCDYIQGYLFYRPLAFLDLKKLWFK